MTFHCPQLTTRFSKSFLNVVRSSLIIKTKINNKSKTLTISVQCKTICLSGIGILDKQVYNISLQAKSYQSMLPPPLEFLNCEEPVDRNKVHPKDKEVKFKSILIKHWNLICLLKHFNKIQLFFMQSRSNSIFHINPC